MIEYLVKELVDEPGQVTVTAIPRAESTTYEVRVAEGDLGKVIGSQGRIANALRILIKTVAKRNKENAFLDIVAEPS